MSRAHDGDHDRDATADQSVPGWLRSAAGPTGPSIIALRRVGDHLEIEVRVGHAESFFLTVHAPGTPNLPFSSSAFAVGYRTPRTGASVAMVDICRCFGEAIAAAPGAGGHLLALTGNAPAVSRVDGAISAADAHATRALSHLARADVVSGLAEWANVPQSVPASPLFDQAVTLFSCVEGRAPHGELPPPPRPREPATPAWARAWAGDVDGARRMAKEIPDGPESWGLLGVLNVLEHRWAAGLELLDRALAHGGDEELQLHRARALAHLGRLSSADRAISCVVGPESFGRRVLKALVDVRRLPLLPTFRLWRDRVTVSEYLFNGLFSTELPALLGTAALGRALESRSALIALLEQLLDRMAGNLGMSPTFAEEKQTEGRRFVPIALPPLPRHQAVEALHSLRFLGAARAEAALNDLLARRPRSVHARTHRGELYLWLGRYDDAWQEFVAASRIERARWADVGKLAVLTLTGRHARARMAALYARYHFMSTPPGGTLQVYRGILRRQTGSLHAAIADLRAAVKAKPTRVGARTELCLALRAAGLSSDAAAHAQVLSREAAPLLVDTADALRLDWRRQPFTLVGDDVLEAALSAMRGNRSSSLVTWFGPAGDLRILMPLSTITERASQILASPGEADPGGPFR
jgi:tetratricopeptide (TPR) repeat protein